MADQLDLSQFNLTPQSLGERRFFELKTRIDLLAETINARFDELLARIPIPSVDPDTPAKIAPSPPRTPRMRLDGPQVARATSYQPSQANTKPVTTVIVHRRLMERAGFRVDDRFQIWMDPEGSLFINRNPRGRALGRWGEASVSMKSTELGMIEIPESACDVADGTIRIRCGQCDRSVRSDRVAS